MSALFSYLGLRVILDAVAMSDHAGWDFSRCRSPARAKRRSRRFGHSKWVREILIPKPQGVMIGDTLILHPDIWAKVQATFPVPSASEG